ncbi:ubiquitin carboxyl-terminal hydrolase CYLD-like isoform X2 [Cynoglossus semilaevis]|uniref:ubiquitinyl hydrolase 1 n=1 Tax=Cynoglossus semilaevis TaxID=244447 RepID=A0A3P8WMF9_CYNSE|nr:ubiquitin carboxyl-terminal hydrolase CYLD-like isoform X2 [Cynoglossus semilaevis]
MMSGANNDQGRKRRPPRVFAISTDLRVQDQVEGSIRLLRGFLCQEQDVSRTKGDWVWVKVLDNNVMVKIERKFLLEIQSEHGGLLEAVTDLEARLKLINDQGKLQQLATLAVDSPLWVQIGQKDELAEAELKYIGPLNRGSGVYFGVQLKGSAAGKGVSNGSYKGHQLFVCPEGCALFLPISDIRLRHWPSKSDPNIQEKVRDREQRRSNGHQSSSNSSNNSRTSHQLQPPQQQQGRHQLRSSSPRPLSPSIIPRTTDPALTFTIGQRVTFQPEETVYAGEVRFCDLLPGRPSAGTYVGILLDTPSGNWDGHYRGEKLCDIPSPLYGLLLPLNVVYAESKPRPQSPLPQSHKPLPKPAPPPVNRSTVTSPPPSYNSKVALIPPGKQAVKPPPLPPPKPTHKPLSPRPPPLPPPKPRTPSSTSITDQSPHANGIHSFASSLLLSPDGHKAPTDIGEACLENEFEVGSLVEVNDPPIFGVICWIGHISGISEHVAGIELDHELSAGTDGSYLGERYFRCPPNKGLFVKLRNCRRDSRFPAPETPLNQVERCNSIAFAEWGSERVEEHTPPVEGEEARQLYDGCKRGIQGHLNSCYLDATLFSLFSCCSSADWVLFWPSDLKTDSDSSQAQDLLRCEIVNPLRRYGYVCASKTMALRHLLEAPNSDTGFTNQEKDPEEFLNRLFQLLQVEPLLKIRSMSQQPQECHLYQLFPPTVPHSPSSHLANSPVHSPIPLLSPSSTRMRVASVQTLLESSFLHAGLKFVEAPSCLLLLMPRFGKDFKMFDAILPTLSLDITDLLDDTLRQCSICQATAEFECLQCYDDVDITPGRPKQFCSTCNTQVHSHRKRMSHSPVKVGIPDGPWSGSLHCTRRTMSLFAVTCIETSHYVSFIKHGPLNTDWLFFDSMADREGGQNGFNIPRVMSCPEVGRYLSLSEEELSRVDAASIRETTRRLLCDSYMCLYHSPELSLYK